jgi:hypothetical protein
MKKVIYIFISLLLISGCAWLGPTKQNTKNQDKIDKSIQKVEVVNKELNKNDNEKLSQSATYAYGVQYSLNQVTEPSVPVYTALKLNGRVMNIVGNPDLDELKKITQIVDLMNSEVGAEKARGEKLLNNKDKEIVELQNENKELKNKHDIQIANLIANAKSIARKGDNAQATIDDLNGNLGFNAIWYGLKHFFLTCLTYILIFAILFFVLRVYSVSNPIAGAIFSFFEMIAGGIIRAIKGLVPNSIDFSNLINLNVHNKYKQTLDKIVDTIERFKLTCDATNKQCSLSDVLDELDRKMDQQDKDCIKDILKDQKWN